MSKILKLENSVNNGIYDAYNEKLKNTHYFSHNMYNRHITEYSTHEMHNNQVNICMNFNKV